MPFETIGSALRSYNTLSLENDRLYHDIARRLGLSDCTLWILYTLRVEPAPLTLSRLCHLLHLPKQTLHSALKSLEKDGCILQREGTDRRNRLLYLTDQGVALARRTADQVIAAEQAAFSALSSQEQRAFLVLFAKYTRSLRQYFTAVDFPVE